MRNKIILIGASGHGKVIADIAQKNGYSEIAFLDDNDSAVGCAEYPVLGKCESAKKYADYDFIVSIGNESIRKKIQEQLEKDNLSVVTLIHPNAVVAESVKIGRGSVVMAGAVINSGVRIGNGCIINTCSSVDHDCDIGAYVHVSVGAHIAGNVTVGNFTWIGAGATIINNINIVGSCMIGAGAVVVKDIRAIGTYVGVPARRIKK